MIASSGREAARLAARYSMVIFGLGGALATAGCSSSNSNSGTGGAGGAADAATDVVVDTAPTPCAGMAISFDSNVAANNDPARSRVMVDFGADGVDTDLPLGNSPRTVEFWAYVLATSWVADANTMFEYGNQAVGNAGFGLDFSTLGRIDPYTNGSFDNDNQPSGIADYTTDQWIHFAMTYDQTAVTLYVNGNYMAGTQGASKMVSGGMLATMRTMLTIGGNPRGAYFNGAIDEFRMWNIARSQADIMSTMGTTLVGNEPGLVGYWKFDDGTGTTAVDSVTTDGHTAHDGTLMAATPAMNPTWIQSTAPIFCK
jgi:Concanavalin A-like lectin/glucanases superfamily